MCVGRVNMAALPLPPLAGAVFCPAFAIRPCSFSATSRLANEMALWLVIHSWNDPYWKACYASREQLGKTLGISVRTVSRQLGVLKDAALIFEAYRGREPKTRRDRPPARWALDPLKCDIWRPAVERDLARLAEEDGHGSYWHKRLLSSLDGFERRSRGLGNEILMDSPVLARKPKRNRSKQRSRAKSARGASVAREVGGLPPGEFNTPDDRRALAFVGSIIGSEEVPPCEP
jgi:DNA-binding transcriptional ArsR family regulator